MIYLLDQNNKKFWDGLKTCDIIGASNTDVRCFFITMEWRNTNG